MTILEIIDNVVKSIADNGNITNITENNGIYTVYTSVNYLENNQIIKIFDTDNFNKKYKISEVTSNSFKIRDTVGLTITTLGTWEAQAPYYDYGKWVDLQTRILSEQSRLGKKDKETYPMLFVLNEFSEKWTWASFKDANLKIYAIQEKNDLHQKTEKQRNAYMPYLRKITELFITNLKKTVSIKSISTSEDFFMPFPLADITQMIEIEIELKYNKNTEKNCLT